jgi:predicted amidophosphoribosyltransferase
VTLPAYCSNCGAEAHGRFCSACGSELAASSPGENFAESSSGGTAGLWWARLQRAASVRVGCMSIFAGVVIGAIAGVIWEPLTAPVAVTVIALCWVGAIFNDEQALNCPRCRKMVKLGADTCHHCGAPTTPQ